MKTNQFRSILAVAVVAASITASLLPAQAIPLDEVLDSAGKAFVRGMFNIPAERQESQQAGGFSNETPQPQATPANPVAQQNSFNPNQSSTVPQPNTSPQQPIVQRLRARCVKVNGLDLESISRDSS
jgi:hypothetical protein